MVTSVTAIILHAIAGDLECWTCGTQELAADFLVTLLMFAEDNITMHLQPLVKLLHKALSHVSIESKLSFSHLWFHTGQLQNYMRTHDYTLDISL